MQYTHPWPRPPEWLDSVLPKRIYEDSMDFALEFFGPKGHSPQQVREWILGVCTDLNISPSYLAKLSGVAASTVNRFLRQPPEDSANLTATTIDKLQEVANKEVVARFAGPVAIRKAANESFEKYLRVIDMRHDAQVKDYILKDSVVPTGPYCYYPRFYVERGVQLHGEICNERYFDPADWAEMFGFYFDVPMVARDRSVMIAMPITGSAAEPVYRRDSVLIGKMLCTAELPLQDGSNVIAFRRREEDNKINCGVWRLERDPRARCWLLPVAENEGNAGVFLGTQPLDHIQSVYISHEVIGEIQSF